MSIVLIFISLNLTLNTNCDGRPQRSEGSALVLQGRWAFRRRLSHLAFLGFLLFVGSSMRIKSSKKVPLGWDTAAAYLCKMLLHFS